MAGEVRRVGVVGLGTMGAGIAQVCAQAGVETLGVEVSEELGERARERAAHYLGRGVEKGRLTAEERDAALDRLTTSTDRGALAGCDLVIEAIVEDPAAKRELFAELRADVAADDLEPGLQADLCDPGAHGAEADDADATDLHGARS